MPSPEFLSLTGKTLSPAFLLGFLLLSSCGEDPDKTAPAPDAPLSRPSVRPGIDVLQGDAFRPLREAGRVGLITNQTSVNAQGRPTRLLLHEAPEVDLVALFTPEHGLDGTKKAAVHIEHRVDPLTGLTAYSLYGPTRKPTPAMLEGLDTLVFDLQDIGCRSYTYISTMILAMEACGELGKRFMVLDRPNPLGGLRVQGPPLEPRWKSFVGQIPVPYVHGMTAGELATMANARGWIPQPCSLTVIPLQGWRRGMTWEDTGLTWIPTSPNIPTARSPLGYVATGILGGLSGGDIGIGSPHPFEVCAAKDLDPEEFTTALHRLGFPGVFFTPYTSSTRPGSAGARLHIHPHTTADLVALDLALIHALNRRLPASLFSTTSASALETFRKVYGSTSLEEDFQAGLSPAEIARKWEPHLAAFRQDRTPYLLYLR